MQYTVTEFRLNFNPTTTTKTTGGAVGKNKGGMSPYTYFV
jgi:hypothetical protein